VGATTRGLLFAGAATEAAMELPLLIVLAFWLLVLLLLVLVTFAPWLVALGSGAGLRVTSGEMRQGRCASARCPMDDLPGEELTMRG